MQEEIKNIKDDIRNIKENHLSHIEEDITNIKTGMAKIATNQDWIMRFFWVVATSSIGALIAGLFNLMK